MELINQKTDELASQLIDKIKLLNPNQQEKIISLVDTLVNTFLEEKQDYEEKISRLIIEKTKKENGGKLYKEQLRVYEVEEKALIRNKHSITMSKPYLEKLTEKVTGKKPVESVSNKCRSILVSKYMKKFIKYFIFLIY